MRYALLESNIVINFIVLNSENSTDFPNAVPVDESIVIGDAYRDGYFYRDGVEVSSYTALESRLAATEKESVQLQALSSEHDSIMLDQDFRLLLIEKGMTNLKGGAV